MAKKKMGGLGKGLDLLFADLPETSSDDAAASTLPLREIEPDPAQPRKQFDDDALNQLADSITENGLLQPIAVRPKKLGTGYIIIAGERRWRAARLAGLDEVPVIIKDVSDEQAAALALIENLQREDLNPMEEALGFQSLMDSYQLTQEETARVVNKSRPAVTNALRLLHLPESVGAMVADGRLSAGHARAVLSFDTEAEQIRAAEAAVQDGLSVRALEKMAKASHAPAGERRAAVRKREPFFEEVELALTEQLGRRVRVIEAKKGGVLQLEFYDREDLKTLAGALAPQD